MYCTLDERDAREDVWRVKGGGGAKRKRIEVAGDEIKRAIRGD